MKAHYLLPGLLSFAFLSGMLVHGNPIFLAEVDTTNNTITFSGIDDYYRWYSGQEIWGAPLFFGHEKIIEDGAGGLEVSLPAFPDRATGLIDLWLNPGTADPYIFFTDYDGQFDTRILSGIGSVPYDDSGPLAAIFESRIGAGEEITILPNGTMTDMPIVFRAASSAAVPDSGTTGALMGFALLGLAAAKRRGLRTGRLDS